MNTSTIIAVAFLATVVAGCATSYKAETSTGGYYVIQLEENIFEVRFQGNEFTFPERASDFVFLRSAELTLEKGFKYFVVIDHEGLAAGLGTFVRKAIACFREKPEWPGLVYDARILAQALREKYSL